MPHHKIYPFNLTSAVAGDKFLPVQTGSVTFSGATTTVSITAVTLDKAVLQFTYEVTTTSSSKQNTMVCGKIDSTTQLAFERTGTSGDITVQWFLWEAKATTPMTVQRGESEVGLSGALPVTKTISSINTAKSFLILSYKTGASSSAMTNVVGGKIKTATTIEIGLGAVYSESVKVCWQVIENTDWTVEAFDISITGLTANQTITATPLADSFLVASANTPNTGSSYGEKIPYMEQTTTTNVLFSRTDTTEGWDITGYVVDTKGDFTTQHVQDAVSSGGSSKTVTITAIDLARAIAVNGSVVNHAVGNPDFADLDGDEAFGRIRFPTTTSVKYERIGVPTFVYNFALTVHEIH